MSSKSSKDKDKDKEKDKTAKNLKKLNHFFDKNASLSKRFRSLISYIERASAEELNKFFNENFYMIYGVFLDTFSACEGNCKKGRHSQSDVQDLLTVLRNVLLYLQELVRKRWQIRSIAGVLEKVLYKENKAAIRVIGFELLLYFLEALQSPEEPQTDLLGCAIDFAPFLPGYASVNFKFQTLSAPEKTSILVPSTTGGQTVENSVKLLEILLDYMGTRTDTFPFWWNLFKQKFVTVFYPDISKELGLLDDDSGFRPQCPWQIQSVLIPRLEAWMKIPEIAKLLWSNEENTKIMLEFYRQSCFLPISCDATIRKSFAIYRSLFIENPIPEVKEKLVEYRKFFLQKLAIIFTTETPQNVFSHVSLCLEILQFFKHLFQDTFDNLEVETQEVIQYTLLDTTTSLLKQGSPNAVLAENLASVLMDTILYIWIRTKTRKEQLWKALQDGISSIFHSMEPVIQTKIKVLQLTLVIKDLIYPFKEKKKKVVKVTKEGDDTPGPPKKPEAAVPKCPDTLPPLQEIKRDPPITDMPWTVDEIKFAWTQMLLIFNRVNSIDDPNIHAEAISCITEVVQILMVAENLVPYQETLDESRPQPLSLINIFGPWLFECCAIPNDSHIKGKADAYGTLCRLIVRQHVHTLPLKLLSHFYGIIHRGLLTSSNTIVSWAILSNANNIFNLALPGANILIPYFLREARTILGTSANPTPPPIVKQKAIMILCSLVCYPNHLAGVSVPVEDNQIGGPKELKYPDLRKQVFQLLTDTANNDPVPDHKIMCIWGICVQILEDLFHTPNVQAIIDSFKVLLSFCTHHDYNVARSALDSLSCISLNYKNVADLDHGMIETVTETLCQNIIKSIVDSQVNRGFAVKEQVVADHFYCLLDWIMYAHPDYLFDKVSLASKLFEAIELGLIGQKSTASLPSSSSSSNVTVPSPSDRDSKSRDKSKDKKKRMSVREPEKNDKKEEDTSDSRLNPTHGSAVICEAAEILWMHLLSFLQNFPCKEGIDIHSSLVTETDDHLEQDPSTTFYVFNDSLIVSVIQVPHPSGGVAARIILRDQTGKYAWDSLLTYDNPKEKNIEQPVPLFRDSNVPEVYVPVPDPELSKLPKYQRDYRIRPKYVGDQNCSTTDQLDQLLEFLSETSPDCLPETKQKLNLPAPSLPEFAGRVKTVQTALLEQASEDQQVVVHKKANKPPPEFWMIKPADPPIPLSSSHYCRLLLNHLGFLVFDRRDSFSELENSPRFLRSLAQLDKTMGREMLKIGVIYVTHGQDDQKIILRNESKRHLYKEFVRGLGWNIDIATHRGYLGGLDPKLTTGTHSPYFANSIMEVIFHDISAMPTNPTDSQQIHKKRHVGNDIVHIVYSEHVREYSPQTITSQFNDAHIIVYPLSNGLFRIQVYRKDSVNMFGPLIHGMCVSKKLLPILVRQTAINANRYVRYNTDGYTRPYPTRRRALDEIVKRYKVQKRYEDIVAEVTSPTPAPPSTPATPAAGSSGSLPTPNSSPTPVSASS